MTESIERTRTGTRSLWICAILVIVVFGTPSGEVLAQDLSFSCGGRIPGTYTGGAGNLALLDVSRRNGDASLFLFELVPGFEARLRTFNVDRDGEITFENFTNGFPGFGSNRMRIEEATFSTASCTFSGKYTIRNLDVDGAANPLFSGTFSFALNADEEENEEDESACGFELGEVVSYTQDGDTNRFEDEENWTDDKVPGATDQVVIPAPVTVRMVDDREAGSLTIAGADNVRLSGGGELRLNTCGTALKVTDPLNLNGATLLLAGNAEINSELVIDNSGELSFEEGATAAELIVHAQQEQGESSILVIAGSLNTHTTRIGQEGDGLVALGNLSEWSSDGQVFVGGSGDGKIRLVDSSEFETSESVSLGLRSGGSGTVEVSDASWVMKNTGSGGVLIVGGASDGTFSVISGSEVVIGSDYEVRAATENNSLGTLSVEGFGSTFASSGSISFAHGRDSLGLLTVQGGAVVSFDGNCSVGLHQEGVGRVTVDGANSKTTFGTLVVGDAGPGAMLITGGGLVEITTTTFVGTAGKGDVDVSDAGSVLRSESLSVGGQAQGSLEVGGAGRAFISGATKIASSSGSRGTINVAAGGFFQSRLLSVAGAGTDKLQVQTGGTVHTTDINFGSTIGHEGEGETGTVEVQVGGQWINSGRIIVGSEGTLTVGAGGLVSSDTLLIADGGSVTGTRIILSPITNAIEQAILDLGNSLFGPAPKRRRSAQVQADELPEGLVVRELTVEAGGTLVAEQVILEKGGSIGGDGTLELDVTNDGVTSPGGDECTPGRFTVNGNYTQSASGELAIKLGGLTPGATHDVLAVTGDADLAGTLRVEVIGTFRPAIGDTFDVLTAGSVTGEFDQVAGSGTYEISYGQKVVTARVVEAPTSARSGCQEDDVVGRAVGTGTCGTGACGAGVATIMPLMIAGLVRMRIRPRRTREARG